MTPESENKSRKWEKILIHEMFEYFFNFAFLAFFLIAFAWYRRLILASYHIQYLGYWAPLIEAAVLAKVIMIGDALRMGRAFRNRPLVVPVIYRTVVFSVFVVLFSFLEHVVDALIHGKTAADGIAEITSQGGYIILAWCVVIIAAFLPFFTVKEIERVLGTGKIRWLFFRGQVVDATDSRVKDKSDTTREQTS